MALTAGTELGHYRIVSVLGSGGMGEVYAAEDTRLHRRVALKLLPADMMADPDLRARFEREAHAVAALNHPNIVTIYAVEQADDVPFLAMELVEGKPLAHMIPRGGLPLDLMLKLAISLADATGAAHQRGITHRDLKPANIMVGAGGHLKVLDFGIAKLRHAEPDAAGVTTFAAPGVTGEGRIIGTAAYMSPEQAEGKPIDHRTDIFSLGIVLYEMATGDRPFKGDTPVSTISSIVKDTPVPLTDINRALPRDLTRIVRRALAKDPERRYQSAKDLRNDLEELKQSLDSGEAPNVQVPVRAPAQSWWAAAAVGGVAVGTAILMVVWLLREFGPAPRPEAVRAPAVEFTVAKVTSRAGLEQFPSLSPDGKWLIYSGAPERNADIYLQSVGGQTPINLTKDSPDDDSQPAFSRDGDRIVFRSERDRGGLFVMGRTGESVTRLTDNGFNPAWSPDAAEVAYAEEGVVDALSRNNSHLWVVTVATGARRRLTDGDGVQPSWSPHGQRIAYWAVGGTSRVRDIWTIPAAGGEPLRVTDDPAIDWNPVWAPDGRHLYFLSNRTGAMNLWRVAIDEVTGRPLEAPEPVPLPAPAVAHVSLSADGKRLAFASILETANLQRAAFDPVSGVVTGSPVAITNGTGNWQAPAPSPDGQWVAFQSGPPQEDIFVARLDGSGVRQLTNDPPFDRAPVWSPDASRLAFYSNRGGVQQIWSVKPDGSNLKQLTDHRGSGILFPVWSPDGSRMAAGVQLLRKILIFDPRKPWSEQQFEELPTPEGSQGTISPRSWSPDGTKLACVLPIDDATVVYSFGSKRFDRHGAGVSGTTLSTWLADSRRLLVTAHNGDLMVVDTQSGKLRVALSLQPDTISGRPFRDDRQIVFSRASAEGDIYMVSFK
jgi:Tol biopolymer transport system component